MTQLLCSTSVFYFYLDSMWTVLVFQNNACFHAVHCGSFPRLPFHARVLSLHVVMAWDTLQRFWRTRSMRNSRTPRRTSCWRSEAWTSRRSFHPVLMWRAGSRQLYQVTAAASLVLHQTADFLGPWLQALSSLADDLYGISETDKLSETRCSPCRLCVTVYSQR